MDVAEFLRELQGDPRYAGQLVHVERIAERPGRFAAPERPLPDELARLLAAARH